MHENEDWATVISTGDQLLPINISPPVERHKISGHSLPGVFHRLRPRAPDAASFCFFDALCQEGPHN